VDIVNRWYSKAAVLNGNASESTDVILRVLKYAHKDLAPTLRIKIPSKASGSNKMKKRIDLESERAETKAPALDGSSARATEGIEHD